MTEYYFSVAVATPQCEQTLRLVHNEWWQQQQQQQTNFPSWVFTLGVSAAMATASKYIYVIDFAVAIAIAVLQNGYHILFQLSTPL